MFYRTFRKVCDHMILSLMCVFFMAVSAKNSIILEFSNMMIYFSVLLFCSLFIHLHRQEHGKSGMLFLVLASFCLCLQILSYPSSLVLFLLVLFILNRYSVRKNRDMVLCSSICFLSGSIFCGYLIIQTGWDTFWLCVRNIVTGDSSHTIENWTDKMMLDVKDIRNIIILLVLCGFLSAIVWALLFRKGKYARWTGAIKIFLCYFFSRILAMRW